MLPLNRHRNERRYVALLLTALLLILLLITWGEVALSITLVLGYGTTLLVFDYLLRNALDE